MAQANPVGVFMKSPRVGSVKTRLGESIGMRNAAEFYAVAVAWLFRRLRVAKRPFLIFYDPPEDEERIRRLYRLDSDQTMVPQSGEDLGERMYNALCWMREHADGPPVIIGSDAPDLPTEWITEGQQKLRDHRLVLGPAQDGGYYLIGARSPTRTIFDGVNWSTSDVLNQTIDRARDHGWSPYLLPPWRDIDTIDDLMERL